MKSLCYSERKMKPDQRLWRMLHVLIHMSHQTEPMTSQAIGEILHTHPVVVRRTMAGLRDRKLLSSEKGPGGGWRLLRPLDSITLLDVYEALDAPTLLAWGPGNDPPERQQCLVEKAVNQAVDDVLTQARELLLARFAELTLARIESDFYELLPAAYRQHVSGTLFCHPSDRDAVSESP